MELIAKYVYQVYKDRSFSDAAKTLYISQPALSAAIAKLEREMGIRIFDRSKHPLSLTPQGRIYIEAIEEIMESESNMRRRIRELSDMSYGSLTIGGSSYTSYFLMSGICGAFYKKYPKLRVTLDIGNIGKPAVLTEKLKAQEIDLLFTYTPDPGKYIIAQPLMEERLLIAMRREMPGAERLAPLALTREEIVTGQYDRAREIEDLSIFQEIEFIEYENKAITGRSMAQMLGDYKTARYAIHNARHSEMHYNLMCAGVGAVMTTDSLIAKTSREAENILYFMPKCKESHRTIYLARNHSADENPIVKNFIQVAEEMCAAGEIFRGK